MNIHSERSDLAHRMIVRAARKAPPALAERLEEEWLADLESRSGALSRLRLALGCRWATGVISRELAVPQLATGGAITGYKLSEARLHLPVMSRRTLTFVVIAGFHGLVIYGLASGFAQHVVEMAPAIMHGSFTEAGVTRLPPPPPLGDYKLKSIDHWDDDAPAVHPLDLSSQADPVPPKTVPPETGTADPGIPPPMHRVSGGPSQGFPATDDFYPTLSRRMEETGTANVQVCVDPDGRLNAAPTLAKTSGNRRIDEAALRLAKAGSGHYRPTTENGVAVNSCYAFKIKFQLGN